MKPQETTKLAKYERILTDFVEEAELTSSQHSIEHNCKIGLKKFRLAKDFAQIDNDILKLSLESAEASGMFFTDLLYLEAKRLRFKEEALKCLEKTRNRTKIRT